MKIEKKDWLFIALIVVVVGIFLAISGKEKTKVVPNNATHKEVYDVAYQHAPGPDASIFRRAFFKPAKKLRKRTASHAMKQTASNCRPIIPLKIGASSATNW